MQSSSPPPQTPTIQRPDPLDDSDSDSSQVTTHRRSPLPPRSVTSPTNSTTKLLPQNYSRPGAIQTTSSPRTDLPLRADEHASQPELGARLGHRPRQRSQGYFEPSLPSNSSSAMSSQNNLSASQIAAQAAMHVQNAQHMRKRSTTIPEPGSNNAGPPGSRGQPPSSPPPLPGSHSITFKTNGMTYQNGTMGTGRSAATTAANAAFPRSPLSSPGIQQPGQQEHTSPKPAPPPASLVQETLPLKPVKEKGSKMKLFSKPKNIRTDKDAHWDKRNQALPSPGKIGIGIHSSQALNRMMSSQSTTSLVDPLGSSGASLYSTANGSTSTLVPSIPEREKEKHKHHFLSRQKHKLKEKDDHMLPLSSASSTSRLTDPSATQPLYSFAAPASPAPGSSFANSVTGLDLRHGGRHLREKKKAEKAAAYLDPSLEPPFRERNQSFSTERSEWPSISGSLGSTPGGGLGASPGTALTYSSDAMSTLGHAFGIGGLSPDDAWPLLKARLLQIFEGEDPRPPVEDFNALVAVHVKRCIQKRSPILLIEDLGELLTTGFSSLDQTLRHVPDDRLIPHLVEMWLVVFTTILPFLQAVFLPLDLEFRGKGIMSSSAAADFWGVLLPDEMNTKSPENKNIPILGELDVRRITLLTFRDTVILPRNDTLMAIFSRLSLENLNAGLESPSPIPVSTASDQQLRPGTAGSTSELHVGGSSLNSTSQGSTSYLESAHSMTSSTTLASSSRSRATSNTSAGSFSAHSTHSVPTNNLLSAPPPASLPPAMRPQPMDSAKVTETVGRMLQCVSVLVSLQSGDEAQEKMSRLNKELKYNWLGRGRTGRQRQGFVGPRRGGGITLGLPPGGIAAVAAAVGGGGGIPA
ncbi:HbrB-like protein [Aaosphaeria arxii CBS 175.79]|uniref:HbrB-like protein n=1 Tax=Aaosphaeria arxii CBS 175.79 TaxID=1450172 RepID=A0A6A5XVZ2_9PLEO|nr:HbrB-like protein [Aaosphaeria arxii CBS 175.79]KAF2016997.1 HbrB-like protein [Aaosphaeria arxii CBS 175.79]